MRKMDSIGFWRFAAVHVKWWSSEHSSFNELRWTSISDVGRTFDGAILRLEDYLEVEEKYLSFFEKAFEVEDVDYLLVGYPTLNEIHRWPLLHSGMNKQGEYRWARLNDELINYHEYFCRERPDKITRKEVRLLGQLILRELVFCELVRPSGGIRRFELHFGYDYYVYLVTNCIEEWQRELNSLGLYL